MQRSLKFSMQYALCARRWYIAQNAIWLCQSTKHCPCMYGQDISPVTTGTGIHTSAKQQGGKIKNTKKKIVKKIKFAKKSIKSEWEAIGIRHNMTVEEIAQAMGKDTDHVFEALFYIPKTDEYDQPHKVIKDLNITKQILDKSGFRWKMDEKKKEIIKESKDAYKRPPPDPSLLVRRPPVVTIMGHVDHGKTTLLDALRKSNIVAREYGGITQHIGAFSVTLPSGDVITFLDTPGHAAFSAMRARGAHVTDVIVLVVAAEDGVMKQTLESIKHAQQAKVPLIVAINKIDKHRAEIENTKQMLIQSGVTIEDDGGDVPVVPISALKRMNLDQLQETIVTVAELLELSADPSGLVEGAVVEAKTDPGRGRVSTVIVQRGTLQKGTCVVAGTAWGKVRNMFNDQGEVLSKVFPGQAAEVSGWKELPAAGDTLLQVESEARAKEVVAWRLNEERALTTLQDLEVIQQKHEVHQREYVALREERLERGRRRGAIFRRLRTKEAVETNQGPELSIVIKADVDGSVEAILNILDSYDSQKCRLVILQHGVGVISEHDIEMAATFGGIIYAFNVTTPPKIATMARNQGVEIHDHNVIYKLVDDLKTVLNDRLPLADEEQIFGEADVAQNFEISVGHKKVPVAGCRCTSGELQQSKTFKLVRNGEAIFEGSVSSLRHFKDEVSVIKENQDCGVLFSDPSISPQPGDHLVCYDIIKVKQRIDWELDF